MILFCQSTNELGTFERKLSASSYEFWELQKNLKCKFDSRFSELFVVNVTVIFSHFMFIQFFLPRSFTVSHLRGAAVSGLIQSARLFFLLLFVNGRQYVITWAELSVWPAPSAPHPRHTLTHTFKHRTHIHKRTHRYKVAKIANTHTHMRTLTLMHTHKYKPPQLEVHSCCCLPCRDQKNILYSSPGENLPSHNKHKPSAQFEAPHWVVSVAIKAKVPSGSPAW